MGHPDTRSSTIHLLPFTQKPTARVISIYPPKNVQSFKTCERRPLFAVQKRRPASTTRSSARCPSICSNLICPMEIFGRPRFVGNTEICIDGARVIDWIFLRSLAAWDSKASGHKSIKTQRCLGGCRYFGSWPGRCKGQGTTSVETAGIQV